MKKKILATAALAATLSGNANAQSSAQIDQQIDEAESALQEFTKKTKIKKLYMDVLSSEMDYEHLANSYAMNMLRGGHYAEKDSLREELKKNSIVCIDKRIELMQTACPELQAEQLYAFVNTMLDKENSMNDFSNTVKGGSIDDRYDLEKVIARTSFSEYTQALDVLDAKTIQKVSLKAKHARMEADKNSSDYKKDDFANILQTDEIRLKRLHEALSAAKKAGITFDRNLLKNAIKANSKAEKADIGDYERSDINLQIIPESRNKIVSAVENMGRARITVRSYPEKGTISWAKAREISQQNTI